MLKTWGSSGRWIWSLKPEGSTVTVTVQAQWEVRVLKYINILCYHLHSLFTFIEHYLCNNNWTCTRQLETCRQLGLVLWRRHCQWHRYQFNISQSRAHHSWSPFDGLVTCYIVVLRCISDTSPSLLATMASLVVAGISTPSTNPKCSIPDVGCLNLIDM